MYIHVNPQAKAPVYRQIQRQIARAITNREIHPGDLLEPQADLATQLAVSPTTIQKAYLGLRSDGLCDKSQAGHFRVVSPNLGATGRDRTDLALSLLRREFLTQELQAAREVQHRLLPPPEVCRDGWRINGRCYPAGALAGDFYDVIASDDGIVDLVIADVAGKGLAAGLIMAAARSLIRAAASEVSPGSALEQLNRGLFPVLSKREFVALAYVRFDPGSGALAIANAGLPDPYLLRDQGGVETLVVAGDRLPLGARENTTYSTAHFSMTPTDRLLLVTDGIPEAVDAQGKPLGYEGLARLVESSTEGTQNSATGDSGVWLDRLLEQVSGQTSSMLDDDWTAVLLEYQQP